MLLGELVQSRLVNYLKSMIPKTKCFVYPVQFSTLRVETFRNAK